jgi:hypothetical protein
MRAAQAREVFKVSQTNYWRQIMANGWTLERRQRQAELIRQWKPWVQSTGPKSAEGKALVSRNAWRGGYRAELRELTKLVNAEVRHARELINVCR